MDVSNKRSLRQLVGPVGMGYLRRAVPPPGVWTALVALVAAGCLPGILFWWFVL
ncbi:MAG: hypothetical protein JHC82_08270, partial [Stenotrophomonas sp.]|nr:hypothetical protein [Stenotrophomonas sp.]